MTDRAAALVLFPHVFEELARGGVRGPRRCAPPSTPFLAGAWTSGQIAGFAVALRLRGEDADTIAAAAEAMGAVMIPGGARGPDRRRQFAALAVTARARSTSPRPRKAVVVLKVNFPVAKHGNRSVSSLRRQRRRSRRSTSRSTSRSRATWTSPRAAGITFLFAPAHHPALRAQRPRPAQALAVRTIFMTCARPRVQPGPRHPPAHRRLRRTRPRPIPSPRPRAASGLHARLWWCAARTASTRAGARAAPPASPSSWAEPSTSGASARRLRPHAAARGRPRRRRRPRERRPHRRHPRRRPRPGRRRRGAQRGRRHRHRPGTSASPRRSSPPSAALPGTTVWRASPALVAVTPWGFGFALPRRCSASPAGRSAHARGPRRCAARQGARAGSPRPHRAGGFRAFLRILARDQASPSAGRPLPASRLRRAAPRLRRRRAP